MTLAARRYVALVRGINVGGHGVIPMAELRGLFESLGASEVSTYIQSGNVLFTDREADRARLTRRLEKGLAAALDRPVSVFVLTRDELEDAAACNPFDPATRNATQQCQLMFLSAEPDAAHCKALMEMQGDDYRFHVRERVLYYAYDRSRAGRRRRNIDFERVLGVTGTTRTWKVVDRLIHLLG
jgi:uncharacterized protein (DUF1697 family)